MIKSLKHISILGWNEPHYGNKLQQITSLANKLAQKNYIIHTGAGGGFMNAANRGAYAHCSSHSIGHTIREFYTEDTTNTPAIDSDKLHIHSSYVKRKYVLLHSNVLLFCPGGFGTVNEFTEAVVQKQLKLIRPQIICFDASYWSGMKQWLSSSHEQIQWPEKEIDLITDNVNEIFTHITAQSRDSFE